MLCFKMQNAKKKLKLIFVDNSRISTYRYICYLLNLFFVRRMPLDPSLYTYMYIDIYKSIYIYIYVYVYIIYNLYKCSDNSRISTYRYIYYLLNLFFVWRTCSWYFATNKSTIYVEMCNKNYWAQEIICFPNYWHFVVT